MPHPFRFRPAAAALAALAALAAAPWAAAAKDVPTAPGTYVDWNEDLGNGLRRF